MTPAGGKVFLRAPENIKIIDLLSEYMKTLNLDDNLIGNKFYFLYDGCKLKKKDYEKTLREYCLTEGSTFMVIDSSNLIGG